MTDRPAGGDEKRIMAVICPTCEGRGRVPNDHPLVRQPAERPAPQESEFCENCTAPRPLYRLMLCAECLGKARRDRGTAAERPADLRAKAEEIIQQWQRIAVPVSDPAVHCMGRLIAELDALVVRAVIDPPATPRDRDEETDANSFGAKRPVFRARATLEHIYVLLIGAQVRETKAERASDLAEARTACEAAFQGAANLDGYADSVALRGGVPPGGPQAGWHRADPDRETK